MTIEKPSSAEDEYFAKLEFERKKKAAESRERLMKEEERHRLRDLHQCRPQHFVVQRIALLQFFDNRALRMLSRLFGDDGFMHGGVKSLAHRFDRLDAFLL